MAVLSKEEFYNQKYAPTADWNKLFYTNPNHFQSANPPSDYKNFLDGVSSYNGGWSSGPRTYTAYAVDKNAMLRDFDNAYQDYKDTARDEEQKQSLAQIQNQENTYNSLASQIAALSGGGTGGAGATQGGAGQQFNQALSQLSAGRNYGSSDLGTMLNFQVSDQQIVDDYNNSRLSRLNSVIDRGNAQIAGISERLKTANDLLSGLPAGDARRTTSELLIKQLNDDLNSVTGAVTEAQDMQKNFTPITMDSPEGLKEITSLRSFLQLPEERASQQLYQIDPDSYRTAVSLGRQYRDMATQPLEPTTTPETEQLRKTIEEEAMNQLRLGSTIGAEERRGYEQAIRGAQTARGNIFGLGPAVQEAAQIGAAGEQRKLARFGAAQQFLGSGETSGAARARDLLLREGIQQNRLGAAAGFIAGGPSIGNLAQARTAQQQGAMQGYIQANQALPGGFNQQASTASNFYQTVDPGIPVALTGEFNKLYNTQSNYLANTYGAQVDALSRVAVANSTPNYLSAGADIFKGIGSFGGQRGIIGCWVAREVYGAENPKWIEFRNWMAIDAPAWFRNLYIKFGEQFAKFISNKPTLKNIIRKWMDGKIG
jgi:hypothetical protein